MTRPIPLTALLIVAALLAAEGVAAERITESTRRYEELWKPSEGARPGLSRRVRALFRDTSKPAASEPVRPADEADTIGYPATDIHRLGEALESTPATTATAAWRRPQRPKHHVGDRIQNDEPLVAIHQLQRRRAFPREADYRPSKLFRPHPSTRRVWRTLRLGDEVLAATSGGLLQLAPDRPPRLLLPGIQVHDLDQDVARTDAALVATSRGLFRFLGGEVTPVHPTPTTSVLSLPSRGLRLTGHPHGVVQWVSEDGAERITRIQSRSPILYLVVHDRRVFAANGEGFWSIHPNGDVFEEAITPEPPAPPLTWLGVHERAVHAGTPLGMYRLSPRGWEQVGPQVHVLGARSLAGTLLVGTADSGTFEVSGGSWVPLDAELPEVTDFARAPGGRLVVGTLDQGLLREAEVGYRPVLDLASEPPGNRVTGLAWSPDRRSLFVGTYDHGVGLLAAGATRWKHLGLAEGLPSLWTNEVATDGPNVAVRVSNGTVAIDSGSGHFRVQGPETGWPKSWTSSVARLGGELLATTHGGWYSGAPGRWAVRFPIEALRERMVLAVLERPGRIYVGTHKAGLWVREAGTWRRFSVGTGLPDSWIPALAWYRGDLWAGTFHGGLLRFPRGEVDPATIEVFRAADTALPGDHVQALHVAADHLWIGTQHGLGVLDQGRWHSFHMEDGLPSEDVIALENDGRSLWVGTHRGLVQADLAHLVAAAGSR